MTRREVFEKYQGVFAGFDRYDWYHYYNALNAEAPADRLADSLYFLKQSEGERICCENALEELKEKRKRFPQAAYEVRSRDLD